jgi:4'-phosphopantetheinyl transferase
MSSPVGLAGREVHLYRLDLERCGLPPGSSGSLRPFGFDCLSEEEVARAARFRHREDGHRFAVTRTALRMLLGCHMVAEPAGIQFAYGAHGKPSLPKGPWTDIQFNISHSDTRAVIAMTLGGELGVDIERRRFDIPHDDLVRRFFSARERDSLEKLAPEARHHAFFRYWTAKEAYIKGRGEGLTVPLDRFDVALGPDGSLHLAEDRISPGEAARWSMLEVPLPPGWAGAVAVSREVGEAKLRVFDLRWTSDAPGTATFDSTERHYRPSQRAMMSR